MSTQNTDQGIVFDSIKIGLASPGENPGVVPWRGIKAGDNQLQNTEARERRSVL